MADITKITLPNNQSYDIKDAGSIQEPASDGTSGQVLTTDGNYGRSWLNYAASFSVSVSSTNWTLNSSGIYYQRVSVSSNYNYQDFIISPGSSYIDIWTQNSVYCYSWAFSSNQLTFTLMAKTQPTSDFYVKILGIMPVLN